jgi:hypothetical protein
MLLNTKPSKQTNKMQLPGQVLSFNMGKAAIRHQNGVDLHKAHSSSSNTAAAMSPPNPHDSSASFEAGGLKAAARPK